jgi:hypothetical protein
MGMERAPLLQRLEPGRAADKDEFRRSPDQLCRIAPYAAGIAARGKSEDK